MMEIKEQKDIMERIKLNTDGQSVIVPNGLRVRGDSYKLTDGIVSADTTYIGFQYFYGLHGFLEKCPENYNIYLVKWASGINREVRIKKDEMKNPLIISKELIKKLEDII